MSVNYNNPNLRIHQRALGGALEKHFAVATLKYLKEEIIDHLYDSLMLETSFSALRAKFNDFSFVTAPAYKALEGFLFQLADDLKLPSSNKNKIGSYYFDEEKIDKHIDKLLKEVQQKSDNTPSLDKYEKNDIKARIKEMKDFLKHYRHSPSHFLGERIDTIEKAERNIRIIFGLIDNTTSILLKAKLISPTTQM